MQANGRSEGLFLVRDSVRNSGHVVSAIILGDFYHFQIKVELRNKRVAYLVDTESGESPEFPSLIALINYLLETPHILPAPLVK